MLQFDGVAAVAHGSVDGIGLRNSARSDIMSFGGGYQSWAFLGPAVGREVQMPLSDDPTRSMEIASGGPTSSILGNLKGNCHRVIHGLTNPVELSRRDRRSLTQRLRVLVMAAAREATGGRIAGASFAQTGEGTPCTGRRHGRDLWTGSALLTWMFTPAYAQGPASLSTFVMEPLLTVSAPFLALVLLIRHGGSWI